METWHILLGAALLIGIPSLIKAIKSLRKSRRQKRLDKIAREILADFDFNEEKREIKSIGGRYVSSLYRCPRCGGMLVVNNGKYGKFRGCNQFPECKYTRDIGE